MSNREYIAEFFRRSLHGTLEEFDFDGAFEEFLPQFWVKAANHGLLDPDDLYEMLSDMYGNLGESMPEWSQTNGFYCSFSKESAVWVVVCAMNEHLNEAFASSHGHIADVHARLCRPPDDLDEQIQLFDDCVHCQHTHGYVLNEVGDPDKIRKEVEAEVLAEIGGDWKNLHLKHQLI